MSQRIAIIPGDGIGMDVTAEAVKVLQKLKASRGLALEWVTFDWGAEKYLREGISLPEGGIETLRREFAAVLLGAVGDPRIPSQQYAAEILLGIRSGLDLYVNLRPVRLLSRRLCPLKELTGREINFIIIRENTEGLYAGLGGTFKPGTPEEVAVQEDVNTRKGVERILVYAFEEARRRGFKKVCMSDKANAMPQGHGLWTRTFADVRKRYPDVEARHLYVDTLAMEMVKNPCQFHVIVTCNLFGDILSDLAAQLQGGLGLAPSANIHPGAVSMFEPVHGSAPDLAGKDLANPFAAVLAAGLMLEHLGYPNLRAEIEGAVTQAIEKGQATPDLGGRLRTREVGDLICAALD